MTFSLALDPSVIGSLMETHIDEMEEFPEEPSERDFEMLDMLEAERDYLESLDVDERE